MHTRKSEYVFVFRKDVLGAAWSEGCERGPLVMVLQIVILLYVDVEREAQVSRGHAVDKTIRPKQRNGLIRHT